MEMLIQWIPVLGGVGLVVAFLIYRSIKRLPVGNDTMKDIASQIHLGAMAFLKREYVVLSVFVLIVVLLLGNFLGVDTALAYLSGALFSVLAGFFGMQAADGGSGTVGRSGQGAPHGVRRRRRHGRQRRKSGTDRSRDLLPPLRRSEPCQHYQRICDGRFFDRSLCPCRRGHLYQSS